MPGRLILFIITLLVIVTFIGFNIENASDIRVWFGEKGLLTDVPIFVSFFVMYLIGVLSVIPFVVGWRLKKRRSPSDADAEDSPTKQVSKKNVRVLGARKKSKKVPDSDGPEISREPGAATEDADSSEDE